MLIKFTTKSIRVKALCFFKSRPWILVSLYSGEINLWDFNTKQLVENYDDHIGPVRGLDVHSDQVLFVSGGDDAKIKIWKYFKRQPILTISAHSDYIRTVQFHEILPWIVSASDDHIISIWNFQNNTRIACLTGHNHYVMSAFFHPTENVILSSSLDGTIRTWDIGNCLNQVKQPSAMEEILDLSSIQLFADRNYAVKCVVDAHNAGVNFGCFGPKQTIAATCGDDRQIKIWSLRGDPVEINCFRGHHHNVSAVVFHRKQELLLSVSEDKSLKVWNLSSNTCIFSYQRQDSCFWTIAAHPKLNYFAIGHDKGMILFKLKKERPVFVNSNNNLLYLKDKFVRNLCYGSKKDTYVLHYKYSERNVVHRISYNASKNMLLLSILLASSDVNIYELYDLETTSETVPETGKKSLGIVALWYNDQSFVVLDKLPNLVIKNAMNEVVNKIYIDSCTDLYEAFPGHILIKFKDDVKLFNVDQKVMVGKIHLPKFKFLVWSPALKYIAFCLRCEIIVCNQDMQIISRIQDRSKIKSLAWYEESFLIYTTPSHIKYSLVNGDMGMIRTLSFPLYLTRIIDGDVFALDHDKQVQVMKLDLTECLLKLSLVNNQLEAFQKFITSEKLVGQAIIAYVTQKGYHNLALKFVKDPRTRFELSLESGDINAAYQAAKIINEKNCWQTLSQCALWNGCMEVVEACYVHLKQVEKLVFLYLVTGNLKKLKSLYSCKTNSQSVNYQIALLLGDLNAQFNILKTSKFQVFAQLTNKTFNLNCNESDPNIKVDKAVTFILPVPPLQINISNWPTTKEIM